MLLFLIFLWIFFILFSDITYMYITDIVYQPTTFFLYLLSMLQHSSAENNANVSLEEQLLLTYPDDFQILARHNGKVISLYMNRFNV